MKQKAVFQKYLSAALALLVSVGVLSACGGKKTPPEVPTDAVGKDTAAGDPVSPEDPKDSNGYLLDSLPETYNFDEDFRIYTWDNQKNWEWVDKGATIEDTVSQKLVERQNLVEERFGITFKMIYEHGDWDNRQAFVQTLASYVQNNQHAFDLVGQYTPTSGIAALQGLYYDLNDIPHLDPEKPWWPSSIQKTCTVGDKLYFITGDITPTLIRNVHCMVVNTGLYASYNLADLVEGKSIYDLVRSGNWTLETMKKLALGRVGNLEDQFGLTFMNDVTADSFFYGAGFSMLENTNGVLALSNDLKGVRLLNFFDEIKALYTNTPDAGVKGIQPFLEGRAIFYAGTIADSQRFSQTEGLTFSVLPMPKLDTTQTDYRTCSSLWVTMYSVPFDAPNKEMSGMILEALGSQAYRTVSDEIYYNIFQARYNLSDGNDSAEMFDMVSDSVVFDTARFFADELAMFATFRVGVNDAADPTGTWSTIYGGDHETWEKKIQNLYGKIG